MKKTWIKSILYLHILIAIYSTSGIFSKLASQCAFMSFSFCLYYGCIIGLLGIYAIGWQQIIKHLPLTVAFANKAVTIIWGIIWGVVFFHESVSLSNILGAAIVFLGVILYVTSASSEVENNEK